MPEIHRRLLEVRGDAVALQRDHAEIIPGAGVILRRRLLEQRGGRGDIFFLAIAGQIGEAKGELRVLVALIGREPVPAHGLSRVLRRASALLQQGGDQRHRGGVMLVGADALHGLLKRRLVKAALIGAESEIGLVCGKAGASRFRHQQRQGQRRSFSRESFKLQPPPDQAQLEPAPRRRRGRADR